jgi:hypothetical protein
MRLTRLALVLGFVMGAAALGCSGGSGSKYTGFVGILASCGYPACYLDLISPCAPDGACVDQTTETCGASACSTPTTVTTNLCFDNGAKEQVEIDRSDPSTFTMTSTWKKDSTVCCTITGTYSTAATTSTFAVKNAAGTTVATVVDDMTAQTVTITCAGGSPVVVAMACLNPDGGTLSACTTGICAP